MKTKISRWITVKNGIITDVYASKTAQPDMIETPWNSGAKIGEKICWYDQNYMRVPDHVLVETGIRIDSRGTYYNKNDYKQKIEIRELDVLIPENYTGIKPIENEPCVWENGEWVIDGKEKEARRRRARIEEIIKQLHALDEECLTPRVLSGIARGDEYAVERAARHEELAEPLREELQLLKNQEGLN